MNAAAKNGDRARERLIERGRYLYRVTEDILVAMEDMEVNRTELARRLGKNKSQISKLLQGSANMTLGTLSDIAFELNLTLEKTFKEYTRLRKRLI